MYTFFFCCVYTCSDASAPLSRGDFLRWVEKGLKIDISGDVSVESAGKALGVWPDEEQKQQQEKQHEQTSLDPGEIGGTPNKAEDVTAEETTGVEGGGEVEGDTKAAEREGL